MSVSVVIVNWNTRDLLRQCLTSLARVVAPGVILETIVVDNGSTDGSVEVLREQEPDVMVVEMGRNAGFSAACNAGMRMAKGQYLLLVNPDVYCQEDALGAMVRYADDNQDVGFVGCVLRYENGDYQETAGYFDAVSLNLPTRHRDAPDPRLAARPVEVDWIKGACLLVRYDVCRQVGMLDPRFFVNFETGDWSYRAKKAGWRVVLLPDVSVVHLAHRGSLRDWSRLRVEQAKSRQLLHRKHLGGARFLALKAGTCLQQIAYLLGMGAAAVWPFPWPRYVRSMVASRLNVSYSTSVARAILRQALFSSWLPGDKDPHPDATPRALAEVTTRAMEEPHVRAS